MQTAWIPLDACGVNAPSIELVLDSPKHLLTPDELNNPAAAWRKLQTQSAQLKVGDVVLMEGHCVHRTHVIESMSEKRDCLEFRFLEEACLPSRFSKHQLVGLNK